MVKDTEMIGDWGLSAGHSQRLWTLYKRLLEITAITAHFEVNALTFLLPTAPRNITVHTFDVPQTKIQYKISEVKKKKVIDSTKENVKELNPTK